MGAPLEGLRVIELDSSMTGAQTGQMLADFGAEVVLVEPPGGSVLRAHPSWPLWGRGKRSVVLDLSTDEGRAAARSLAAAADVLVESFRPGTADRLGLGYDELSASNPRLIYVSITGWGRRGPYRDAPGYEGLVLAKLGEMWSYWQMTGKKRPAFVSTPYASVSATHAALHGILGALTEREHSGAGQRVETSLALAVGALDPWGQALHMITSRYPDAFSPGYPYDDEGNPLTSFASALLVAMTSDGYWLQFSQVQPRLFRAMLEELGLGSLLEDPYWAGIPNLDSMEKRIELLELLQREVRKKSLAQWQEIFDRNENVFAETFRQGSELLHHPQVVHDGNAVVVEDPRLGPVLQPAPPVCLDKEPARVGGPAPLLDADRAVLGTWKPRPASPATAAAAGDAPPLAGLTVLELGSFYAAPYGATILTDLGARVIKIEETGGDHFRLLIAFPEAAAMKVLQGKQSLAVDIGTPEGRQIVLDLAKNVDLVLSAFRAGVAKRHGLGAADFHAVNAGIIYVDSPGYGTDGPYGRRPAFAPTISAGTGVAMRNIGQVPPPEQMRDLRPEQMRPMALRLTVAANKGGTQPDGISALTVGTALSLAAYLRATGRGGHHMKTSMLLSTAHALSETMLEYEGKPVPPTADAKTLGYSALYRLYLTSDGWVFLAAHGPRDWPRLVAAVSDRLPELTEAPWQDGQYHVEHDAELATLLEKLFLQQPAAEWEGQLLAAGVGCVVAEHRTMESSLMGEFGQASGFVQDAYSPIFDMYPRLGPLVSFSRSQTRCLGGCITGQHTDEILAELGHPLESIALLRNRRIVR